MKSMLMALRKRQINDDDIDRAANGIVRQLESSGDSDVQSKLIGELVMNALAEIDNVAYIRYASVYRNFREAKDFEKFVEKEIND
jgi:transcriptional repressor NrdR